jgi:hypothetical protein
MKHIKFIPTSEDRYKEEVKRHKSIFDQVIGCKISKITIPKDSCGNASDSYNLHVIDIHHSPKIIKISSSEWISMTIVEG